MINIDKNSLSSLDSSFENFVKKNINVSQNRMSIGKLP